MKCKRMLASSVADPEFGAFLTPGSGMGKISGSGMNIPDHISESLNNHFWVKIIIFFDADPGFGMEKIRIGDPGCGSGINIPDPKHCLQAQNCSIIIWSWMHCKKKNCPLSNSKRYLGVKDKELSFWKDNHF
jgi:hypothetical protein